MTSACLSRVWVRSLIQQQIGHVEVRVENRDHEHAVAKRIELGAGRILLADIAIGRFLGLSSHVYIRSRADQSLHRIYISLANGKKQRRFLVVRLRSDVGPSRDERLDGFGMSLRGRPHQRRLSAKTLREVHIRARGQQ